MHNKNEVEIEELEKEVRGTFENIEKLTEIMHNFEGEIKEMEVNISSVSEMTG